MSIRTLDTVERDRRLVVANANRLRIAAAKRAVAGGTRPIGAVLADQDEALAGLMLADLLLLTPSFGRRKLHALGRRACVAQVNLMVTLGDASLRTRQWVSWEMTKNQAGMLDADRTAA